MIYSITAREITDACDEAEYRGKEAATWWGKGQKECLKCASWVEGCYEFALSLELLFSLDLSFEIFQGKVM